MKKRLSIVLCAAVIMGLAGCSGGNQTAAVSGEGKETEKSESVSNAESSTGGEEVEDENGFASAPELKFKFAENQAANSSTGTLGEEFCRKVKEQTGGTVQIEFYPDALLGDEASVVGMIEAGTVELTRVNLASMQSTVPETGVLTLPYLYKDAAHCNRVLKSEVAQEILDKCQDHGFVGLRMTGGNKENRNGSFRCFYSSAPIRSLDDLKGKKIRVQESEVAINMVKALGGVPTPMANGEVFQALQTGVIDLAENDPGSYYLSGHYEVAKYYTYDNHQISPSMYIMSSKAYDSMTEQQRNAVMQCLDEYIEANESALADLGDEYIAKAQESGCEFIEIDTAPFREAAVSMYDQYPEYAEYIEKIEKVE